MTILSTPEPPPEDAVPAQYMSDLIVAGEEPVFAEPWQAYAFALAVSLSRQGHFAWSEWTRLFGEERKASATRGDADNGTTYFRCWLTTLERIVVEKNLSDSGALAELKNAWADAYRRTPHGQPVTLDPAATRELHP